ncbi:hypothetical protein [Methanoregula formicica]|uniref:Uncharacterized protein n=1 Tax=Methanoregula formicica (strain DSM 22288 / NBRC 105244 / SMSP) TaxID=593750 RepID=L0HIY7_METFS|nr:hypothetical protein [Methanoregula formicica]AGB03268.1 hypothetical protein Metfor_2263 [Methanoregula formicica SMSP]
MAIHKKRPKTFEKNKKAGEKNSDYKLIIVLAGAVILAFLMIYVLILTSPA